MFRVFVKVSAIILLLVGAAYCDYFNRVHKNYPYQAGVDEALNQFPRAKADWLAQLQLTKQEPPNERSEIVKVIDPGEHGDAWYIMYDETNDLVDIKSPHLSFYKTSIYTSYKGPTLGPSHESLKSIAAAPLGDGYYLVISWSPYKGYNMIKHTDKPFEFEKFNCSTFIEPITQSCPDQWPEIEKRTKTLNERIAASKYRPKELQ